MQLQYAHSPLTNRKLIAHEKCAFVLLALLWTSPILADEIIPFVLQDSQYRTNLGICNLDRLPADVSILLFNNNSRLVGTGMVQVPGQGFVNLNEVVYFVLGHVSELPFEGYIRLQSTKRIVAFASQIQNANNGPGIIPATTDNVGPVILPVTSSIEPWSTTLVVLNLAARATVVRFSLRGEDGSLVAEGERTLEGSSQWISSNIHRDLGVQNVRGSLTVRSLDAAPLAVVCRHSQTYTRQAVFQQPFDLKAAASLFYLPYRFVKDLHQSWVVLNNLDAEAANVKLEPFSPEGIALGEYSLQVPALGSALIAGSQLLAGQEDQAPYGIIRGTSNRSFSGLIIQIDLATGDTIHTNLVSRLSPEVLIPSVTETSTFSSNLLVSNLGDAPTSIEVIDRSVDGNKPVPMLKTLIPARGSLYMDKVQVGLGVGLGYGPLALRSIEGQPLAAFSHVMNTESGARGSLDSVDSRPVSFLRSGQQFTLRWDAADVSEVHEFRIYRADRATRDFQRIASVPGSVLACSLRATDPGDFTISVRAFDGVGESNPSNEVLVQVLP